MIPWKVLDSVTTAEGELQLRQRGERDFLITIAGRVLMTSTERTSEKALASLALAELPNAKAPRILIGGLGMAYTVRAALDALPPGASITVAELTPQVLTWCQGPLAPLTNGAVHDRRVHVVIADFAQVVARARPGQYDAIIIDLYEGPHAAGQRPHDPLYGRAALARTHAALAPGGIFAVWTEEVNQAFKRRMIETGFHTWLQHPGGPRAYAIYLGRREEVRTAPPTRDNRRPPARDDRRSPARGEDVRTAPPARDSRRSAKPPSPSRGARKPRR